MNMRANCFALSFNCIPGFPAELRPQDNLFYGQSEISLMQVQSLNMILGHIENRVNILIYTAFRLNRIITVSAPNI